MNTLSVKVAAFKLIARDALRMNLITPRLSRISGLENDIKELNDQKTKVEHFIVVENYELSKLDTAHPDYADNKKSKEESVKILTEESAAITKHIEDTNKVMTEEKDGIAKIESGETKVSLDALNEMVERLVKQDALNQVATVAATN